MSCLSILIIFHSESLIFRVFVEQLKDGYVNNVLRDLNPIFSIVGGSSRHDVHMFCEKMSGENVRRIENTVFIVLCS